MRIRLRSAYSEQQLKQLYAIPHTHRYWHDHKVRVAQTIIAARSFGPVFSVADLSCGDATIIRSVDSEQKFLGDFAPGYQYEGPIEETIDQIPKVDMFICSETIEHLDDPDTVLKQIRTKTNRLILSTPLDEGNDNNPEHYWSWDKNDIGEMLHAADFDPVLYSSVVFPKLGDYGFQIWGCE